VPWPTVPPDVDVPVPALNDTTRRVLGRLRGRPLAVAGTAASIALLVPTTLRVFTSRYDRDLHSDPHPATDYDEAMRRVTALLNEPEEINPVCASKVFDHGTRTLRSVVLLHGYTNCPAQFRTIAAAYFNAGCNVVSLRLPGHGYRDRLTRAMTDLYPADLTESADLAVDIAAGLGERVTVVGLSAGGTLTAWLAAQRDDVAEAILIAPLMVPKLLPSATVAPVSRAARYLPDVYIWWDQKLRGALMSPPYAYPRFSIRSLGAFMAIGRYAQSHLTRTIPLERLVVVTTDEDIAVSKAAVYAIAEYLRPVTDQVVDINFPSSDGYSHDLIDPTGDNESDIVAIYRRLGPPMGIPAWLRPPTLELVPNLGHSCCQTAKSVAHQLGSARSSRLNTSSSSCALCNCTIP